MSSNTHLPLSQALRQHTRHLHRALDSSPRLQRLLDPDLTLQAYADSLTGLWLAHREAEALLLALDTLRPQGLAAYQPRLTALQCDLQALGPAPETPANNISLPPGAISASPLGHYLGMRYVVEGASQGARIIAARLKHSIGRQGVAQRYWEYQAALADGWPAFCASLDAADAPDIRIGALAGATQTFQLFLAVFHEPSRQSARHIP